MGALPCGEIDGVQELGKKGPGLPITKDVLKNFPEYKLTFRRLM